MSEKDSVDVGKVVLGLGLLGLAAWMTYTFVIKPGAPGAPVAPIQPGPGPGNLPAPTGSVGDSASQGDTILVSTTKLSNLPGGVASVVEMTVTGATPGGPVIIAQSTGRPGDGLPQGFGLPIPRSEITAVTHHEPGGGIDPGGGGKPPMPRSFVPVDLGDPMSLVQGHHYRARLKLGGIEATFADAGKVADVFQGQGFADVQVFAAGDPLPSDWPPSTVLPPDKSVYYAQGTWSQASGSVPRPSQIAMAWEQ